MNQDEPITASGLPLPDAFLSRMEHLLGEDFAAFCSSYARVLTPSLRINRLRCDRTKARELVSFIGTEVAWQPAGFYYGETAMSGEIRPGKHPLHEAGLYYIQEASAMLPASLCPPVPGERVLDLCAAPGGKATQLADALNGEGVLIANEIHRGRAAILSQNLERMGVRNAIVTSVSPDELAEHFPHYFHKIVVDAPCSGEGMFRREEDAVRMWSLENVALCAERQAGILDAAAEMLCPGGYLVYSTCTFAPEENEGAVMAFLRRHPDFAVIPSVEPAVVEARDAGLLERGHPEWVDDFEEYTKEICESVKNTYRVLPHRANGEGHFAALLQKKDVQGDGSSPSFTGQSTKKRKAKKQPSGNRYAMPEEAAVALFAAFAQDVFGEMPSWFEQTVPCLFGDRLYLVPRALGVESTTDARAVLEGLTVLRAGVCVGTVIGLDRGRGRLEPDHALAMLAPGQPRGIFHVSYDEAVAYLRGEMISAPGIRGWHIVSFCGQPLGWGKASDGVMKNHYPKGLRK